MVADFIGKINLFTGRVLEAGNGVLRVESQLGELRFDAARLGADPASFNGIRPQPGDASEVGVAVRPEKIQLSQERPPDGLIAVRGTVAQLAYLGDASLVYVDTAAGQRITCSRPNRRRSEPMPIAVGTTCWVAWEPSDCLLLTT